MIKEFKDEYAFLSNMYSAKFTWQGIEYKTVEHAYQANKAKTNKGKNVLGKALMKVRMFYMMERFSND